MYPMLYALDDFVIEGADGSLGGMASAGSCFLPYRYFFCARLHVVDSESVSVLPYLTYR